MIQLCLILLFTLSSNGYDCIPKGTTFDEGFNGDPDCGKITISYNTLSYYFNISFTKDKVNAFKSGFLYLENEITMSNPEGWWDSNNFTFLLNSQVSFYGQFHSEIGIYFHSNSKALIFDEFAIKNQVSFESTPLLDYPPIVVWKSDHFHLFNQKLIEEKFTIVNPNNNERCFDVISFWNNTSALDYNPETTDHYLPSDFPITMNEGIAYLISNKRLLRFCPNGINLDNEVTCLINGTNYFKEYSGRVS